MSLLASCLRAASMGSPFFCKRICLIRVRCIPDGRLSTRAAGWLAGGADLWLQYRRTQEDAASHLLAPATCQVRRRRPAPHGLQTCGTASAASAPSALQAATCSAESWPWSRAASARSDFESGNTLSPSWQLNRQRRIYGPCPGPCSGSGSRSGPGPASPGCGAQACARLSGVSSVYALPAGGPAAVRLSTCWPLIRPAAGRPIRLNRRQSWDR